MELELDELKEEIDILTKRINALEKKESRRKSLTYLKILIKIVLIGIVIFGVWRGYEYLVHEVPNMMEQKIKDLNPFKKNN